MTATKLPREDMVLGRVDPQSSLLEAGQLCGHLVTKGSFYEKLARCGHELISDDDFAHMYAPTKGRPSIPPSTMMRALLLATKDRTSDRESARRSRVDLDWKAALGLELDHPGFGATTFSLFRARVVLHDADQELFRKTVAKAVEKGLFASKVLALIDSSPVLGAGAVKDTYELLRNSIQKVVRAAGEDTLTKGLRRSLARYLKDTKPPIDWDHKAQRQRELSRMVIAAGGLLNEVAGRHDATEAAELLAAIVLQDVEVDPDTGAARIRQATAKDRVVSTTDPDMRHGRKSSQGRFDGHKMHVVTDEATELVLGIDVGAGNGNDADHAAPLVEEVTEMGVPVTEVVGDMAYGGGDTREAVETVGAKMVAKVPPSPNQGFFPKTDFTIDPDRPSVTCPAGHTTTETHSTKDDKARSITYLRFPENACASCLLRPRCVKGSGPRTITLNFHEARLIQARADQQRPSVKRKLKRRARIERKIDHLHDLGAKKARYRGRRKTKLQILLAATVANLARLDVLGGLGGKDASAPAQGPVPNHIAALRAPIKALLVALEALFRPIRWDLGRLLHAFSDPLSCSLT